MSAPILITPRSLTQSRSPELRPLEDGGYELVYACPGQIPTDAFRTGNRVSLRPDSSEDFVP